MFYSSLSQKRGGHIMPFHVSNGVGGKKVKPGHDFPIGNDGDAMAVLHIPPENPGKIIVRLIKSVILEYGFGFKKVGTAAKKEILLEKQSFIIYDPDPKKKIRVIVSYIEENKPVPINPDDETIVLD